MYYIGGEAAVDTFFSLYVHYMQVTAAKPPPQWLLLILRYCSDLGEMCSQICEVKRCEVKYVVNDRVRVKCLFAFSCYVFYSGAIHV